MPAIIEVVDDVKPSSNEPPRSDVTGTKDEPTRSEVTGTKDELPAKKLLGSEGINIREGRGDEVDCTDRQPGGEAVEQRADEKTDSEYPRITAKSLLDHCKQHKLYRTPDLNDVLYLHYKGYAKIENLDKYTGLRALYLECNGIHAIENLGAQTELRCLYLQQNLLTGLDANLAHLQKLNTLNVSHNQIGRIENLACIPALNTLQISHNRLTTADDIEELAACQHLSVVDMSHNRLDDPGIVDVLARMKTCRVLNLMGNPVIKKIQNYRKTMVLKMKSLTYLDDRPVFPREKACTEAWLHGGREAEKEERDRWINKERAKIKASVDAMTEIRNRAQATRQARDDGGGSRSIPSSKDPAPSQVRAPDEHLFTFDVSKAPSSGRAARAGLLIEDVTDREPQGVESRPYTSSDISLEDEDDIETIHLAKEAEKINIDDLPELEDIDDTDSITRIHPRKMLIEEIPADQPNYSLIQEMNRSQPSQGAIDQSEASMLMTEEPDDQSQPLMTEVSRSVINQFDQSRMSPGAPAHQSKASMLMSEEPDNQSQPLITEVSRSDQSGDDVRLMSPTSTNQEVSGVTGRRGLVDDLKEFGVRIPNSWAVLEQEKARKEEEKDRDPQKQECRMTDDQKKIWDLAANAGSTVDRLEPSPI